jgi:hypothetical protein
MLTEAEFQRHASVMEQNERESAERRRSLHVKVANGISDTFGNMAAAAAAFGKKGFKAWKAFATAQALVNTYSSAVGAYNAMAGIPVIGPALAVAAAAAAVAAGLANVAAIQKAEPSGQAHAGMSYIPSESTWMLQRGERVVAAEQNRDLTNFLASMNFSPGERYLSPSSPSSGADRGAQHIHVHVDGRELFTIINDASRDGRLEIDARAVV